MTPWFPTFLGILTGIVIVAVLAILAYPLVKAVWEWLLEVVVDRGRMPEMPRRSGVRPAEVFVSDLHIDTWDYSAAHIGRRASFLGFLSAIRNAPSVTGFILNGDLMDVPLFAGALTERQDRYMLEIPAGDPDPQGVLNPDYDHVLHALMNLERPLEDNLAARPLLRTVFQTGNHDVGVNGLRYVRHEMPQYLPSVRTSWGPEVLLMGSPDPALHYDNWVYFEHGQAHDPFLWLYARYAMLDILRSGRLGREMQFIEAMQRGGRTGMDRSSPGTEHRAALRAMESTAEDLAGLVVEEPAGRAPETGVDWHFAGVKLTFHEWVIRNSYRLAARRAFRQLPKYRKNARGERIAYGENVQTVLFGHTHIPDRYVFPDGRVYINSGDWCGNTPHQCYCVIYEDGIVRGPFQWESEEKAVFALDATGPKPSAAL